ncbi:MAG: AAA family ATPase, partial [Promethearchaeota archaeon]
MILHTIEIKNIRSIKDGSIDFPSSTMLFFGDVGSGKSSVLKSIEFALFGTLIHGDLSGDSLLRRGRNKASVKLTFSIDGKEYSIFRSLIKDRKGRVSQDNCIFIDVDDGTKITLAPTDMRRKILSLLSYSVSRYEKANKLPLFRYTVYTPQEQIKEIIQADPDERFEILKEVFGIEKYEVALRNVDTVKDFLNDYIKETKTILKQIGNPEKDISLKEKQIEDIKKAIKKSETFIAKKEQKITLKEKNVETLQKNLEHHTKKIVQINNKEANIQESKAKQKNTKSKLTKIQKEISDKEEERGKLKQFKEPSEVGENELEITIEKLNNLKLNNEKEKAVINNNIADVNDLIKQGKCSLCGQAIHEKERFEKELKDASLTLKELTTTINNETKEIKKKQDLLKEIREFQKIIIERESLTQLISEKVERAKDLNNSIEELFKSIEENQKDILS